MNSEVYPLTELEKRSAQKWEGMLIEEPELLEVPAATQQLHIRSWEEIPDVLQLEHQETEWLVEGIIPRGSVNLIAGEPGSYKSWLALALLRGLTSTGRFLDKECRVVSVLYLDRENPLAIVRERLATLGVESLNEGRIWGGWLQEAPPAIGDARLLEIARDRKPLIVFDSLIRFHSADENSATEMAKVMQDLRALANAGATVIALHHKTKAEGSRYRGSTDIAGGVDTAFSVSRDREAGLLTIECFKNRFVEEFSLTLREDLAESGDFILTDSREASSEKEYVEILASVIRRTPGVGQEKLVEESGIAKGKARAMLERLDGKEWRSQRGAHNSKQFFPIEQGGTVEIEV
jgi:predicted ATP-dependent serine protease